MNPFYFGKCLKREREAQNKTQKDLASTSKISIHSIRAYEQLKHEPSLSSAMTLSHALGVSIYQMTEVPRCTSS